MKNLKVILCIIAMMMISVVANSQNIQTYSGNMTNPRWLADLTPPDYKAIEGIYSYYEDEEGNRIIHDKFTVKFKYQGYPGMGMERIISGDYIHGKRSGKWSIIIDGDYISEFQYKEGVLDGPFSVYGSNGEKIFPYAGTLFNSAIYKGQFSNGIITGDLTIEYLLDESKDVKIETGLLDYVGRKQGEWKSVLKGRNVNPYEIYTLYYNDIKLYEKVKDISSGNIKYKYKISDEITKPADTIKITITGKKCEFLGEDLFNVGGTLCVANCNEVYYGAYDEYGFNVLRNICKKRTMCQFIDIESEKYKELIKTTDVYLERERIEQAREDSIRNAEKARKDSIYKAAIERKRIERERQDSIRNADIEYKNNLSIVLRDIFAIEGFYKNKNSAIVSSVVNKDVRGLKSVSNEKQRLPEHKKIKKGKIENEYIVLITEEGEEIREVFKEEYLKTCKGIIGQNYFKEYNVNVASNKDCTLLIVYDLNDKIPFMLVKVNNKCQALMYYTIKSKIGKKLITKE
ncbi:MAG: hypothetical protein UHM08_06525 [Bacteroidales bacterium]|nr:hypothetical protein [Bacteroidales bacterium]